MSAAVVMAMFAAQELGPMAAPVAAKDLVGRWQLVDGAPSLNSDGRTGVITFRADGSATSIITLPGVPVLVYEGKYEVRKNGIVRFTWRAPKGRVDAGNVFTHWVRGGRLMTAPEDSTGWDLLERVNEF